MHRLFNDGQLPPNPFTEWEERQRLAALLKQLEDPSAQPAVQLAEHTEALLLSSPGMLEDAYKLMYLAAHFAFPNIDHKDRFSILLLSYWSRCLSFYVANPSHGEEHLITKLDQQVCAQRSLYESRIRDKLTDLQRRYVDQVLLALDSDAE